jgi:hypothetical protein
MARIVQWRGGYQPSVTEKPTELSTYLLQTCIKDDILITVLSLLTLNERRGSCSLICRRWQPLTIHHSANIHLLIDLFHLRHRALHELDDNKLAKLNFTISTNPIHSIGSSSSQSSSQSAPSPPLPPAATITSTTTTGVTQSQQLKWMKAFSVPWSHIRTLRLIDMEVANPPSRKGSIKYPPIANELTDCGFIMHHAVLLPGARRSDKDDHLLVGGAQQQQQRLFGEYHDMNELETLSMDACQMGETSLSSWHFLRLLLLKAPKLRNLIAHLDPSIECQSFCQMFLTSRAHLNATINGRSLMKCHRCHHKSLLQTCNVPVRHFCLIDGHYWCTPCLIATNHRWCIKRAHGTIGKKHNITFSFFFFFLFSSRCPVPSALCICHCTMI